MQGIVDGIINISDSSGISSAIDAIASISDAMDLLDQTYAKFISNDESIDFSNLTSLKDMFGNLDGFEDFASVIQNSGSTVEQVQQAFGSLTGEYLRQSDALKNISFDNAEMIAQGLQEKGVVNALEIVYAQLGLTVDQYSQIKAIATARGIDLANITYEEIQALINETGVSQEAGNQIYILALKKALANENVLSTTSDITNLQALVTALGGTTTALDIYNAAKSGQIGMGGTSQADMEQMKQNALKEAQTALTNAQNSTTNLANTVPNINYSGGANTAKAMENNLKDAEKAAKDAADALKEAYDNFTKLMSHKEAMGIYDKDPMQYVEDLGTLASQYVYDQETAWAAEEKIYQAREKLLDDWIKKAKDVYADYLDMLDVYQQQIENKIKLSNDNASKSTYINLFKAYVTEAKKNAEERNYLQKQLNDYLSMGGTMGDDRWTELTKAIADANTKIDETKLALRDLVNEYRTNWIDAIENTYKRQIDSLENYKSRLQDLYDMTGDTNYLSNINDANSEILEDLYKKRILAQQQLNKELEKGLISENPKDGEAYEGFLKLKDVITDIDDAITQTVVDMKSFADTSLDNWLESITKLGEDAISLLDDYQSRLKSAIDEIESSGNIVGDDIYKELISSTGSEINVLTQKLNEAKTQLNNAVKNGLIAEGSEEWQELVSYINETNNAISEGITEINEYNDALMNLDFFKFDALLKRLSSISGEIDNLLGVIDQSDTKLVNDDASFSDDGLATIALNLQQREVGLYNLQQISAEINKLNEQFKSNAFDMSEEEYLERLNELKQEQVNWIEKVQESEGNVLDIYEKQKEAQIQIIQDRIDALQKENDEYQRALDLQKAKYDLIQAMNNRDTMAFNGKEFEYTYNKDNVDSARETYNDLEFKKQISDLEDQIDLLKKTVLNLDDVIGDAIDEVNDRSQEVYETLIEYAEKYGIVIDDSIISAWNGVVDSETKATNALTQFGNTITTTSSKSVSSLNTVKTKINEIYSSANTTATEIVRMMTPDTTYINNAMGRIKSDISIIGQNATIAKTAIDSWNSINLSTLNQKTKESENGVRAVDTAARNANSALSALNSINVYTDTGTTKTQLKNLLKDAQNTKGEVEGIKNALDKLKSKDVTINFKETGYSGVKGKYDNFKDKSVTIKITEETVEEKKYRSKNQRTGSPGKSGTKDEVANWIRSQPDAGDWDMYVAAKGGKIGNHKSPFDGLANYLGEDTIVAAKEGEEILTESQSDGWRKMVDFAPTFNKSIPVLENMANKMSNYSVNNNNNNTPSFTMGDIIVQGVQTPDALAREINTRFPMLMFQESKRKNR